MTKDNPSSLRKPDKKKAVFSPSKTPQIMISKQQELGQDFFLKSMDVDFANMLYIIVGNL
jgi:hypothetical protein